MRQQLIRLARQLDDYTLHRAVYERFAAPRGRHFTFAPIDLPSGPAVLVRGDLDSGDEVFVPAEGDVVRFMLRATVSRHARETGKRGAWSKGNTGARLAWLQRQAEVHGFAVIAASVSVSTSNIERGKGRFWLDASRYLGTLRVTDQARFSEALRHGVGKGKAFGFSTLIVVH